MSDAATEGTNLGVDHIKEHMEVIGSCGHKVGVVDHMESGAIKLAKNSSPDGRHHYIPSAWVARVDEHVHLTKNHQDAQKEWKDNAGDCGC